MIEHRAYQTHTVKLIVVLWIFTPPIQLTRSFTRQFHETSMLFFPQPRPLKKSWPKASSKDDSTQARMTLLIKLQMTTQAADEKTIPQQVHKQEWPGPLKKSWPKASSRDDKTSSRRQDTQQVRRPPSALNYTSKIDLARGRWQDKH